MIRIILFFIISITCNTSFAINPFWVHIDKKLVWAMVNLDKDKPKEVEQYFRDQKIQRCDTTKTNLGFGWKMWKPGIGGGYISISATFFYYNDSIISYSIQPNLPEERWLRKKYRSWYKKGFALTTNNTLLPYKFHEERICIPLKEYYGKSTNHIIPSGKILDYMNPGSGILYGYAGGYGVPVLSNRIAFNAIKYTLTNEQVFVLMHSINPASRLTAIEYYLAHKDHFSNELWIENWIEKNFQEIPKIKVMRGCFEEIEDTKNLVLAYALISADRR